MISGALNIAASSLKTQQQAIDVISHNIANVNTPGYSRQTATLGTATPETLGAFHLGRGVQLVNIQRAVDPFLTSALNTNSDQGSYALTLEQGLKSVESVFGSLDTPGLASSLDHFFQAYQSLANNPQDAAQRNNVLNYGTDIATHLNLMRGQLVNAQTSADAGIDGRITQANQLIDQIATLNVQISGSENTTGNPANDLRDQRDVAVQNLSKLIPLQTVNSNGTQFLVQTVGGDLLVQDSDVRHLARGGSSGTGFTGVVISGSTAQLAGINSGGEIGGLITLRDRKLGAYITQLDSLAANMAFGINQLHASGAGLVLPATITSELGAAAPASALDAAGQNIPFASQIVSGSFQVHVYDAAGSPQPAGGTTIHITAGTTTMNDLVTQLGGVAGITASLDAGNHLVVNAGAGSVGFSNDTSNVLAAYEIGTFFHGNSAASISVSAMARADANSIAAGAIDPATSLNNPGGNSVARQIIVFQNTPTGFDGSTPSSLLDRTANVSMSYAGDVQQAIQQRTYRDAEMQSLTAQRQALAGVSTDQELIDMIQFQRAYEAAAKVVTTSNAMLDSLLGMIR